MIVVICLLIMIAGIVVYKIYNSCKSKQGRFRITFFLNNIKIKGDHTLVSMSYSQKVSVEISPVDANGNPAQVEAGSVHVDSSDPSICDIVRDPNVETRFEILGNNLGSVGVAQVNISADADLGSGVTTISGFIGVEITPKEAVGFGFNIGEPVEQ